MATKRRKLEDGEEEDMHVFDASGFKLNLTKKDYWTYWKRRYDLFSKFDDGVRMDIEGIYSVTPEKLAIEIAERCPERIVLDAFCGVGGNTIQFAAAGSLVIATDIDMVKIDCAVHNAGVYSVRENIEFIKCDFLQLPSTRLSKIVDVVFLSPPWGGPSYKRKSVMKLDALPIDGVKIFEAAKAISGNIIYFLPRNIDIDDVMRLGICEMRFGCVNGFIKGILFYFGNLIR